MTSPPRNTVGRPTIGHSRSFRNGGRQFTDVIPDQFTSISFDMSTDNFTVSELSPIMSSIYPELSLTDPSTASLSQTQGETVTPPSTFLQNRSNAFPLPPAAYVPGMFGSHSMDFAGYQASPSLSESSSKQSSFSNASPPSSPLPSEHMSPPLSTSYTAANSDVYLPSLANDAPPSYFQSASLSLFPPTFDEESTFLPMGSIESLENSYFEDLSSSTNRGNRPNNLPFDSTRLRTENTFRNPAGVYAPFNPAQFSIHSNGHLQHLPPSSLSQQQVPTAQSERSKIVELNKDERTVVSRDLEATHMKTQNHIIKEKTKEIGNASSAPSTDKTLSSTEISRKPRPPKVNDDPFPPLPSNFPPPSSFSAIPPVSPIHTLSNSQNDIPTKEDVLIRPCQSSKPKRLQLFNLSFFFKFFEKSDLIISKRPRKKKHPSVEATKTPAKTSGNPEDDGEQASSRPASPVNFNPIRSEVQPTIAHALYKTPRLARPNGVRVKKEGVWEVFPFDRREELDDESDDESDEESDDLLTEARSLKSTALQSPPLRSPAIQSSLSMSVDSRQSRSPNTQPDPTLAHTIAVVQNKKDHRETLLFDSDDLAASGMSMSSGQRTIVFRQLPLNSSHYTNTLSTTTSDDVQSSQNSVLYTSANYTNLGDTTISATPQPTTPQQVHFSSIPLQVSITPPSSFTFQPPPKTSLPHFSYSPQHPVHYPPPQAPQQPHYTNNYYQQASHYRAQPHQPPHYQSHSSPQQNYMSQPVTLPQGQHTLFPQQYTQYSQSHLSPTQQHYGYLNGQQNFSNPPPGLVQRPQGQTMSGQDGSGYSRAMGRNTSGLNPSSQSFVPRMNK
ncbi:hypothetical protein BLNAU_2288 [Blattamonas nauphoetae]|uniref:Uncharacterized protein n=1 Tax=Blattamonas nauphoetae TaxID=2049346 RepID=A0ABQ9YGG4_9EUKA|nr:hypothetical protein BLNAU_2288 [Blattamonas nauphoetae]